MSQTGIGEPKGRQGAAWRPWGTVVLVTIINIYAFIDRAILALLVEPIKADLQLSDTQIGLLLGTAFVLFYSIANVPAGYLVDRFNRRIILAGSCLAWSSITALSGLAQNFVQLFLGRAGVGLAESTVSPTAFSVIKDQIPPEKRGRAFSILGAGNFVGSALALIVGGAILAAAARGAFAGAPVLGGLAGWQIVLIIVGLAGFPLAFLALLLPERREGARRPLHETTFVMAYGHLREHRDVYSLLIAYATFSAMLTFGKGAWIPAMFTRNYGISPAEVGPTLGVINLTIAPAGALLGGVAIDRLAKAGKDIRLYGVLAAILSTIGLVMLPLMPTSTSAWVIFAAQAAFTGVFYAVGATTLAELTPEPIMGKVTAAYMLLQNIIGQALGPLVVAALADTMFSDNGRFALGYAISTAGGIIGCLSVIAIVLLIHQLRQYDPARSGPRS